MATCCIWKKDKPLGCEIWNGQFHTPVSISKYGSSIKHMKTLVFLWGIHLVFIAAVRKLCYKNEKAFIYYVAKSEIINNIG